MDHTPLLIATLDEGWKERLAGLAVGAACLAGSPGCVITQGGHKSWMQRAKEHDAKVRRQNRKEREQRAKQERQAQQERPVAPASKPKPPEEWPHPSRVAPGVPKAKAAPEEAPKKRRRNRRLEDREPLLINFLGENRAYYDRRRGSYRRRGRATHNTSRHSLMRGFARNTGDKWKPQKLMSFLRNPNSRRALDRQRHGKRRKNPGHRRR